MFRLKSDKLSKKAIAYYRHSAEDKQEFSIPLQREQVQKFAAQEGIEIIHEEADQGVSGLTANRPGFQRLFDQWIKNPNAPSFDYVLVLDVTRWGRWQDLNVPAHYEYLCTKNGKDVIYVVRGMPSRDDRLVASVVTVMERFEASNFSKRLSEKVFLGSMNIAKQGYSVGGTASYGLTRLLLGEDKKPRGLLKRGEHKSIANQRVVFTPANDKTTEIVKRIFHMFVELWMLPQEIARTLNHEGIPSPSGKEWKSASVLRIINNKAYIGTLIYNKTSNKLKRGHIKNPKDKWVIVPNAFPAVIERAFFEKAQERLYWLLPTRWKRGVYAINRAQRLVQKELQKVLFGTGAEESNIALVLKEIPIVYGVSSLWFSSTQWCFLVPDEMRKYPFVLAIGVLLERNNFIDRVFCVPTHELGVSSFRTFSEKDSAYTNYYINDNELESKILGMVKETGLINHKVES